MSKSSFIPKNYHTWEYQLLIPHKQNPHTPINQLAVTAKILSQPGIQLCVASVAVQSWQCFHGLHERLPWLVQHLCLIWTILVIHQRLERYSSYNMVEGTSDTDSKCVSQQAALHSVCMQSNKVAVRLYTGNGSDVRDDCAIPSDKNCN